MEPQTGQGLPFLARRLGSEACASRERLKAVHNRCGIVDRFPVRPVLPVSPFETVQWLLRRRVLCSTAARC